MNDTAPLLLCAVFLLFVARPLAGALYERDRRRAFELRRAARYLMRAGLISPQRPKGRSAKGSGEHPLKHHAR